MRLLNYDGRLKLATADGAVDIATATRGKFDADPAAAFDRWEELTELVAHHSGWDAPRETVDEAALRSPSPRPRQVFAISLNYRGHAEEAGHPLPTYPGTFTKFPSCLGAPYGDVELPSDRVDYEVELVVVIGRTAHRVGEQRAWEHVAGLTVGQDISEREVQLRPPLPQFSLGKSFRGFGPTGPCLVTPDELDDPDDLLIQCTLNGEEVQKSRTSDLVFSVPELVAYLSGVVTLFPGDLIFTGTPAGSGSLRQPQRLLRDGDELVSTVEGIGAMRHRMVAAPTKAEIATNEGESNAPESTPTEDRAGGPPGPARGGVRGLG